MNVVPRPEAMTGQDPTRPPAMNGHDSYLAARQEWMERYGSYIAQARVWRHVAVLALIAAITSTSGLIWIAGQAQIVPYVVAVDKVGEVAAVARADTMQRPDNNLITAQLVRWITAVRSVYVDAGAQRALITEGYAAIDQHGDAYGILNDYMRTHDPFERAKTETVSIIVQSILPIAGETWRIEWREETRERGGGAPMVAVQYQASVSISFATPRDEATIRANPLGLYITAFTWTRRL